MNAFSMSVSILRYATATENIFDRINTAEEGEGKNSPKKIRNGIGH